MDISKLTITQIKEIAVTSLNDEHLLSLLAKDSRAGVQKLHQSIQRQKKQRATEYSRLKKMFQYECQLINQGKQYIAGVDEAGRGPLAGPVVAAAVILQPQEQDLLLNGTELDGLNDSKKISEKKRIALAEKIRKIAISCSVGMALPTEIDRLNIYQASLLAMKRALEVLKVSPEHLLVDGNMKINTAIPQTAITGGDALSVSIAAASIIAKTYRDDMMRKYHQQYPQYNFERHKGYPTAEHMEALERYGPCAIHRLSFEPVRNLKDSFKNGKVE
ncbi:MAG: ribonuclease HII [Desulfotomaculum sp.]|nr:ribonuclease HII [Desulfotomaculum sp.]